jgi:hypothetical protein
MTKPILVLFLILLNFYFNIGLAHAEGSGHSGGGQGIVLLSGEVRFLDSLTDDQIPVAVLNKEAVLEKYFGSHRYVKTLGTKDIHFFDCAKDKLKTFQPKTPAIAELLSALPQVDVIQVEFPLYSVENADQTSLPFPLFASTSDRTPVAHQWAIASYQKDDLWVTERFYNALPVGDQCAVQVHEAFRHLNRMGILKNPLTTHEIEDLTAEVVGRNDHRTVLANRLGVSDVVSTLKTSIVRKELDAISKDLSYDEVLKVVDHLNSFWSELQLPTQNSDNTSDKLIDLNVDQIELGTFFQSAAETLNKYIHDNISNLNYNQIINLTSRAQDIGIRSKTCLEGGAIRVADDNKISKYFKFDSPIVIEGAIQEALTKKLPRFKYFDVLQMRIVTR